MPYYMMQIGFVPEFCEALNENPHDYVAPMREEAERLGGRVEAAYAAFAIADLVMFLEMPDNVSAIAFSKALSTSGATASIRTTPLVTLEEERDAMRKAKDAGYRPPNA